ncbi:MAG TPA: hypothetical protein PL196_11980 [Burkholderiaceae bacterium]|nr:hypothetical protein [Burkholderiaceae bacterium]
MDSSRTYRHQGYDLLCAAKPVDAGRYAPELVVCKQAWPTRPRVIAVQRGDHLTEETAIEAAHAQGIEWILNYG